MNTNFFIEKLCVSGPGKKDSGIEFSSGLNVIKGPSNTGKSMIFDCIDYIFCGSTVSRLETLGYDQVFLSVKTDEGTISFSREIPGTSVTVASSDQRLEPGAYSVSNRTANPINRILLKLCGIDEPVNIIKNARKETQQLTWRTFHNVFMIDEQRIIAEKSILNPNVPSAQTALTSAFLYLLYGNNYIDGDPTQMKSEFLMKKEEAAKRLSSQLRLFEQKQWEVDDVVDFVSVDDLDDLENLICQAEESLSEKNRDLLDCYSSRLEITNKVEEYQVALDRYNVLKTQYSADLQRLSFVSEGLIETHGVTGATGCPLCASPVESLPETDLLDGVVAEHRRITSLFEDLSKAIKDSEAEEREAEEKLGAIDLQIEAIQSEINTGLLPQINSLQSSLSKAQTWIAKKARLDLLEDLHKETQDLLEEVLLQSYENDGYNPKEHFGLESKKLLEHIIDTFLTQANYRDYESSCFDVKTMDIVVNHRTKTSFGKGYRAYLNTILSMSIIKLLKESGSYSPPFLMFDSPLLSLDEPEVSVDASMKSGLLELMRMVSEMAQVIVLENEIPTADLCDASVIEFTKLKDNGRYGFLLDVYE